MTMQVKTISIRGLSETRNGRSTSTLPKEIEKEVNKQLAEIGDDVESTQVVSSGPDSATIIVFYKVSESELKKRHEAEEHSTDKVGDTISVQEANKRALAEKEEVDGEEMKKAEEEFQESLKVGTDEEEVEEVDDSGNKRKVKKRRSR